MGVIINLMGNSLWEHNQELISYCNYIDKFEGEVAELAEGARLLSEYTSIKGIEGSNPSLSANFIDDKLYETVVFLYKQTCPAEL